MALKTKYTGEKENFEKFIVELTSTIKEIEKDNIFLNEEMENTNKNYFDLTEKHSKSKDFYREKILELTEKVINENNLKDLLLKDKEDLGKTMYKISSENIHHNRNIEKNKLFKENKEEKNKIIKDKAIEKLNDIDKLVIKTIIEKEILREKFDTNQKQKFIEQENTELIFHLNK